MTEAVTNSLLASAVAQLAQLALAAMTAAVVVALLVGVQRWRCRGHRKPPPTGRASARSTPARSGLLAGVLILAVLILILAAGLRQIWGHPTLQPRALVSLIVLLVVALVAWWRTHESEAGP